MSNEAEVPPQPPQRIWVCTKGGELVIRSMPLGRSPCDVEYVPASALAEVWEKAIAIVRGGFLGDVDNVRYYKEPVIAALEAARDAALGAGKGEQ